MNTKKPATNRTRNARTRAFVRAHGTAEGPVATVNRARAQAMTQGARMPVSLEPAELRSEATGTERAFVLHRAEIAEFNDSFDAAIASLGFLCEDVRDTDALDLLAVMRHVTQMRAIVAQAARTAERPRPDRAASSSLAEKGGSA